MMGRPTLLSLSQAHTEFLSALHKPGIVNRLNCVVVVAAAAAVALPVVAEPTCW